VMLLHRAATQSPAENQYSGDVASPFLDEQAENADPTARRDLEEFLNRDPKRHVNTHSLFRQLDLNDDGQLTEQEFMRTRVGTKNEQAGRDNFTACRLRLIAIGWH